MREESESEEEKTFLWLTRPYFHQHWWLFNNDDKNYNDATLHLCFVFILLNWQTPGGWNDILCVPPLEHKRRTWKATERKKKKKKKELSVLLLLFISSSSLPPLLCLSSTFLHRCTFFPSLLHLLSPSSSRFAAIQTCMLAAAVETLHHLGWLEILYICKWPTLIMACFKTWLWRGGHIC